MKKEIKDYLHLYLGCKMMLEKSGRVITLKGIEYADDVFVCSVEFEGWENMTYFPFKPILRPLSNMTEGEMKELYQLVFKRKFVGDNITHRDIGKKEERRVLWSGVERLFIYKDGDVGADSDLSHYNVHAPTIVSWQLSKNFDLFGLIEAGLAIDKSTLK